MTALLCKRKAFAKICGLIAVMLTPMNASAQDLDEFADTRKLEKSAQVACRIQYQPLSALTADKNSTDGSTPAECDPPQPFAAREVDMFASPTHFCEWEQFFCKRTRAVHRPLYFEDRALERYGCCKPHQALRSAAHFSLGILMLPLERHWTHPKTCVCGQCATR